MQVLQCTFPRFSAITDKSESQELLTQSLRSPLVTKTEIASELDPTLTTSLRIGLSRCMSAIAGLRMNSIILLNVHS